MIKKLILLLLTTNALLGSSQSNVAEGQSKHEYVASRQKTYNHVFSLSSDEPDTVAVPKPPLNIFDKFNTQKISVDDVVNFLLKSRQGRMWLIKKRAEEIDIHNALMRSHPGCFEYFTNVSVLTPFKDPGMISYGSNNLLSDDTPSSLKTLSNEIARLESFLINHAGCSLSREKQRAYESSRVIDVYLLKMILGNDDLTEFDYGKDSLDRLKKTHESWPPKQVEEIFYPESAFTVVQDALVNKKAKQFNGCEYCEYWTINYVKDTGPA